MVKGFVKISWLFLIGLLPLLNACNEEDATTTNDETTNYVEDALLEIRDSTNVGPEHCYELVFPVTLQLPDETTVEIDSFGELRTVLRDWKAANPDSDERPTLVFPIELINSDGEVITVENAAALKALREACPFPGGPRGPRGPRGGHGGGHGRPGGDHGGNGGACACFEIVFPVTIAFPDNTTQEVAGRKALRDAARAWRAANPGVQGRPELVFPITVKLEDGTTQEVADAAALKALKENCATTGN
ncbi:MAG: hypothetical protein ACK4TA_06755 [Saprospiraceae bacterium]